MSSNSAWEPPAEVTRDQVSLLTDQVISLPSTPIRIREDIFRISALEMDWDIGVTIYEPEAANKIPFGPDGKRVGVLLLHGGVSDFKSLERIARLLPERFGIKVATMTFPGRFYFLDPDRNWPGDVENPDGSARTPLWTKEMRITEDQYTTVQDTSKRSEYGTLVSLSAKVGTEFYHRMAAWPVVFERDQGNYAPAISRQRIFHLHPWPFHGRSLRHDGKPACSQHRRPGGIWQFAVRLHVPGGHGRR